MALQAKTTLVIGLGITSQRFYRTALSIESLILKKINKYSYQCGPDTFLKTLNHLKIVDRLQSHQTYGGHQLHWW